MNPWNYVREQWDRVIAVAALVGGLISLLLGWIGVSGTPNVASQMPYIVSNGLLGIFLIGAATALWLSADLRDEWRELHGIRLLLKNHLLQSPGGGHNVPGNGSVRQRGGPAAEPVGVFETSRSAAVSSR